MIKWDNKNFVISVSHTTRKSRPNEIDGKDYIYMQNDKFEHAIKFGDFLEWEFCDFLLFCITTSCPPSQTVMRYNYQLFLVSLPLVRGYKLSTNPK